MMKQITQSSEDDALWSIQVPAAILKECQDELDALQKWKEVQSTFYEKPGLVKLLETELNETKAALEREQQDCAALRQMVCELRDALSHKCKLTGGTLATHGLIAKANQLLQ